MLLIDFVFSFPVPAAASSRAILSTPSQSGLFGVTSKSITGSSRSSASAKGVPTVKSLSKSIIPMSSSSKPISLLEQSIPDDSTPRIFRGFLSNSKSAPGIYAPMGAYTTFIPVLALGAPQTIVFSPSKVLTVQIFNLSALGCFSALIIFATVKGLSCSAGFSTPSTSSPVRVIVLIISSILASVSRCCFSQLKVNFISLTL